MHIKTIIAIAGLVIATPPTPQAQAYKPPEITAKVPKYIALPALKPVASPQLTHLDPAPFPVSAAGTYKNTYDYGNCTAYVAGRKAIPDTWGNADAWDDHARAEGRTVSTVPIVGAVAQSNAGGFGHVAIVIAVGSGQVQVSEMNVRGLGVVDESWYPIGRFQYIYI